MTTDLIDRIDQWLRENRPPYYSTLRPGASAEALDAAERQLGVTFPQSLRALYRWRDGQRRDSFDPLLLNLTFMPLEAVIENKLMLDGMIGTEFTEPDWWRRDWVPFLENGGGDLLCVDLGGFGTGNAGQVLWFDHETAEREIIHQSIDDFCADLLHRMSTGSLELA